MQPLILLQSEALPYLIGNEPPIKSDSAAVNEALLTFIAFAVAVVPLLLLAGSLLFLRRRLKRTHWSVVRAGCWALAVQPVILLLWVLLSVVLPDLIRGKPISVNGSVTELVLACLSIAFVVVVYAAGHMFLLGLPLFLLLRRLNRINWISVGSGGFVIGCLAPAIFGWPSNSWIDWPEYFTGILYFGLHGAVGATVFYRVLRTENHERSTERY